MPCAMKGRQCALGADFLILLSLHPPSLKWGLKGPTTQDCSSTELYLKSRAESLAQNCAWSMRVSFSQWVLPGVSSPGQSGTSCLLLQSWASQWGHFLAGLPESSMSFCATGNRGSSGLSLYPILMIGVPQDSLCIQCPIMYHR